MLSDSGGGASETSASADMLTALPQQCIDVHESDQPALRAHQRPTEQARWITMHFLCYRRQQSSTVTMHAALTTLSLHASPHHAGLRGQPQRQPCRRSLNLGMAAGRNRLGTSRTAAQPRCRRQAACRLVTRMGIKAVEAFDGSFTLSAEAEATLKQHLSGDTFCKQACRPFEALVQVCARLTSCQAASHMLQEF